MKNKKIVYIDMDDTLCDFSNHYNEIKLLNPRVQFPQSIPNFFLDLLPIKDSIHAYKHLESLSRIELHILTAPSVMNPLSYTEKRLWTEKYLGLEAARNMIICGFKDKLIGDILIDDQPIGKGQEKFKGNLIVFNKEYMNWIHILELVETLTK